METRCFEIIPQLCLSDRSVASCKECLKEQQISHVVTIDGTELTFNRCPMHNNTTTTITTTTTTTTTTDDDVSVKFVYALDQLNFNILELLPKTIEYINQCIVADPHNKVLVHCLAGQSRSVSVITAYLMCYKQITLKESLETVKKIKSDAQPNCGFLYQLWLFESMGNRVDLTSNHYKTFRMKQEQLNYYRSLYSQTQAVSEPKEMNEEKSACGSSRTDTFKCRMCRTVLFTSEDMGEKHSSSPSTSISCSSHHLVEPLPWMKQQMKEQVQGKINCKKCSAKLGAFNWSGTACSCGAWVTPSFQIHKARVDMS